MVEFREMLLRRDIGYVASFEPKDAEIVQRYMDLINLGQRSPRYLLRKFDKIYDDHRNVLLQDKPIEPIKLGKSGNKLVNEGLIALAEFQVGKRTRQFNYYGIGESSQDVNIRDDALLEPVSRLRIPDAGGTFQNRQSTIFYSIFFPKTTPDCTVRETAIFDSGATTNDKMLLRTTLQGPDQIPHKKDFDTIFVAHVIFSGSV